MENLEALASIDMNEKTMEAGVVGGDGLEKVFLRYVYPLEPERTLTIYMDEAEALAVMYMLSGALLASIGAGFDSPDGPRDQPDVEEPGPPGPKEPSAANV